jgi:hypothetical protein
MPSVCSRYFRIQNKVQSIRGKSDHFLFNSEIGYKNSVLSGLSGDQEYIVFLVLFQVVFNFSTA